MINATRATREHQHYQASGNAARFTKPAQQQRPGQRRQPHHNDRQRRQQAQLRGTEPCIVLQLQEQRSDGRHHRTQIQRHHKNQ